MKVWLCIEMDRPVARVSNGPGGPDHCYFTSRGHHLPDCGWKLVVAKDAELVELIARVIADWYDAPEEFEIDKLLAVAILDALVADQVGEPG